MNDMYCMKFSLCIIIHLSKQLLCMAMIRLDCWNMPYMLASLCSRDYI